MTRSTRTASTAEALAAAADTCLVTGTKGGPAVTLDRSQLVGLAEKAGQEEAAASDEHSYPPGHGSNGGVIHDGRGGHLAVALLDGTLYALGVLAHEEASRVRRRLAALLPTLRVGPRKYPTWFIGLLIAAAAVLEVAGATPALNLLFRAHPAFSVLVALVIAVLLSIGGLLLADGLSHVMGRGKVIAIGCLVVLVSVITLATGSVMLRSADTRLAAVKVEVSDANRQAAMGGEVLGQPSGTAQQAQASLPGLREQAAELQSRADLGAVLLIAGMVSLGLAIGLLLKTLIRAGDDAVTLKLTAATQRARLTAQSRGLAEVQRLRQFIEVHNEIQATRAAVWEAWLRGFRLAAPASVADRMTAAAPALDAAPAEASWVNELELTITELEDALAGRAALPLDDGTPTDLVAPEAPKSMSRVAAA